MAFDAFISYSHAGDGGLAPAIERGLRQLAKPWSRRQALRIFRDDTGLSVNPALWSSITDALDDSQYFILLASPGAAQSEWVNREITHWIASRPDAASRILPVVTAGSWVWDDVSGDIDWAASTAAPPALAGAFASEPRHLDLVWAQSHDELDLRDPRFRGAVADLAAPIHGIPKDELESEDVRQHRKAVRLRRSAVGALFVLVIGLAVAGLLALRAADAARSALSDLEDANGNIEQLTAEGAALEAANAEAAANLADTEAARADAEALALEAQEEAAAADAARSDAELAREAAETAQLEAEAAREVAQQAQEAAERGRDAADDAAAVAAEAEAEARRQEAAARAGEQTALDAEAEAVAASAAARAAEAQARADEQAALDAGAEARQQEAQARQAQAAAQAGERLALAAEATALAAEEAARAAEALAREEERQARAAEVAASEAAAAAQQRRQEAEAAALAASLARAASAQSDPTVNALLAVESFCALGSCDPGQQPQSLRAAPAPAASERPTAVVAAADLDPLMAMIDSVSTHQDVLGTLPGWTGRAVDVAVSADGGTIAAVRDDGTARVWHPAAPDGADLAISDAIGVAVSDDGTTVGYVTARPKFEVVPDTVFIGAVEEIGFVDVAGGVSPSGGILVDDGAASPHPQAEVSFQPGSNDVVLVDFEPSGMMVFDRSRVPEATTIDKPVAAWTGGTVLAIFDRNEAYLARSDGSKLVDFEHPHSALPTAASSAGGRVVVGYEDGSLGTMQFPTFDMSWRPAHLGSVDDVALSPDGRTSVSSASDGSVLRIRLTDPGQVEVTPATDVTMTSGGRTDLASARGADLMVVAIDDRLERRTATLSWAGSFARSGVTGAPASTGAVVVPASGGGYELTSPDGTVAVPADAGSGVISADASTMIIGGDPPRIVPVNAPENAVSLQLALGQRHIGPLALSAGGDTAAALMFGTDAAFHVGTFDGGTGEARGDVVVDFSRGVPPTIGNLLVSDEVVVFRRFDRGADRIEVHRHDGAPARLIPVPSREMPMWLTSGPAGSLYIASSDGIVTAYPVAGGDGVDVLDVGPDDAITAVGTEPSGGELMAVGYASGRVELWNLATGTFVVELSRHSLPVAHTVIGETASGLRVTTTAGSGSMGSEAVVRTLDDPDLLRRALCEVSGRDLSEAEWRRFVGVGDPRPCARGLS